MRLFSIFALVIILAILAAQLRAGRDTQDPATAAPGVQDVAVVATSFPEPISTIFILGGAAGMGLWHLARKFRYI